MYPCCCCRWGVICLGIFVFSVVGLAVAWNPFAASAPAPVPPSQEARPVDLCSVPSLAALRQQPKGGGKLDWPMLGLTPARNMASPSAKNTPTEWSVAEGKEKNLKWKADIGSRAYSQPVIAGGKVYIATNNARPRDPKIEGFRAVLMCFNEADGKFLWQVTHEMPPNNVVSQAKEDGLISSPTVEGDRLYYLAPAAQLICAEAATGKEVWRLDMLKDLKVHPHEVTGGSPLVVGDLVFAMTGNGADAATGNLVSPDAPSFLAVNKKDGKLKWKSNLPGKNIIEGQWGNPAWAEVNGKPQVIFPGGDCWLYSFEPESGKLLWKFYCDSTKEADAARKLNRIPNYLAATPAIHDNKLYIGAGMYPDNPAPKTIGHFWCIDLVKATQNAGKHKDLDVSPKNDNFDPKAPENKDSALAWHYGGTLTPAPKFGRKVVFGRTASTAAVQDGLVYISEDAGFLHCLDAATGKKYWEHDLLTGAWGSPVWADNKVYLGTDDGEILIFAHGKTKNLIAQNDVEAAVHAPVAIANGTLFVLTKQKLYAIGQK